MTDKEIKALVSLLDDDDSEVCQLVEDKIRSMGWGIVPYLESEWEESFNPVIQRRLEGLIHDLQLSGTRDRLLVWKEGDGVDLLEGVWIVATYLYPDLSLEFLRATINQLYFEVWPRINETMTPHEKIKALNHYFFTEQGFGPNTKNFHSPSNSMINVVLESKKGNPISLCIIYMLIIHRIGLPVFGVNLPNLFVLTYKDSSHQFYINVFSRGIIFSRADIEHYVSQLKLKQNNAFFEPCSNLDIIQRILRNLVLAYEKLGDKDRMNEIESFIKVLQDKKRLDNY